LLILGGIGQVLSQRNNPYMKAAQKPIFPAK
jgi:hypothetical protein